MAISGVSRLAELAPKIGSVVIGPGMVDESQSSAFVRHLLPHFRHCVVVLDAYAMSAVGRDSFAQPLVLTPHCGGMAHLSGDSKDEIIARPLTMPGRPPRAGAREWHSRAQTPTSCSPMATRCAGGAARQAWRFRSP